MRGRHQTRHEQLRAVLARQGPVGAGDLAEQLGVSVPTLHRLLQEISADVVTAGRARRARYALRRAFRGEPAELPLYEVDAAGGAELVSHLVLLQPQGSCLALAATGWPVPAESRDGWWEGLPYPLHDLRPQGFMGRQFARAEHDRLAVAANPDDWNDDDVVYVLSRTGADLSGNLILGDVAYERWLRSKLGPAEPLMATDLATAYAALAEQAVAAGVPASSAAGEFPKFAAMRELPGSATPHVLVKFSGADASATVQRWADLLVSEHLALECAATMPGVESARSRIVSHAGRTFLEVERFDRHGLFGRSRLSSLAALDAALIGDGTTDWTRLAGRLSSLGLLAPAEVERIQLLWWFGRLIANTDMHTGNLSFRPRGMLSVAPAYDMVPMLYAPLPGGEVPHREFEPPLPLPTQRAAWAQACRAALRFWSRAAEDARISAGFRAACRSNAERLDAVAQAV